jgi:hypothetical protein
VRPRPACRTVDYRAGASESYWKHRMAPARLNAKKNSISGMPRPGKAFCFPPSAFRDVASPAQGDCSQARWTSRTQNHILLMTRRRVLYCFAGQSHEATCISAHIRNRKCEHIELRAACLLLTPNASGLLSALAESCRLAIVFPALRFSKCK